MQLFPIESHSWVAIDFIEHYHDSYLMSSKLTPCNKIGSFACRQLLKNLQQQINMPAELIETSFPYYFVVCERTRWYVSFSHSHQHVAVLISRYPHIGIDVEDSTISEKVAMRFFSVDECQWLHSQPLADQTVYRGLLWRLKECYIKTQQNNDKRLVKELKKNILSELGAENLSQLAHVDSVNNRCHPINLIADKTVLIGNLQALPCSFTISKK